MRVQVAGSVTGKWGSSYSCHALMYRISHLTVGESVIYTEYSASKTKCEMIALRGNRRHYTPFVSGARGRLKIREDDHEADRI